MNILYEFWIEADNVFNIFSLYGRERDKYTESAGQPDKSSESGTVGWNVCLTDLTPLSTPPASEPWLHERRKFWNPRSISHLK